MKIETEFILNHEKMARSACDTVQQDTHKLPLRTARLIQLRKGFLDGLVHRGAVDFREAY